MTETPRKTLTLKRKPVITPEPAPAVEEQAPREVKRQGKRIVRRDELMPDTLPRSKAAPATKPRKAKPARAKQAATPEVTSPSELQAKALDQQLVTTFQTWAEFKPLEIGIENELYAFMQENQPPASKRVIQRLLRMHCKHGKYLQAVMSETTRYHLNGQEIGSITQAERDYAERTLAGYERKE